MIVNGQEAGGVVGPTSIGRLEQLCSLGRTAAPDRNTMLAMPARGPRRPLAAPAPGGRADRRCPSSRTLCGCHRATTSRQRCGNARRQRPPAGGRSGHSAGSGTIIDARAGGEALVLTCGHLFRDSKGTGKIEVEVYRPCAGCRVPGRLIAYDLERDVALVAFQPRVP